MWRDLAYHNKALSNLAGPTEARFVLTRKERPRRAYGSNDQAPVSNKRTVTFSKFHENISAKLTAYFGTQKYTSYRER